MATAVERRVQEKLRELHRLLFVDHAPAETQDIGVVVVAGDFGAVGVVADRRADSLDLVRGDAHADAGPAAENSFFRVAGGDKVGDLCSDGGVVHGFFVKRPEIPVLQTAGFQIFFDGFLQFESAVVGA